MHGADVKTNSRCSQFSECAYKKVEVCFGNSIRNMKELCGKMQSVLSVTVVGVSKYIRAVDV